MKYSALTAVMCALLLTGSYVNATPTAVVGIPPLKQIVEEISCKTVKATTLLPQSADPHTFTILPSQTSELSKAKWLFIIGLPFEERMAAKQLSTKIKIVRLVSQNEIRKDPHVWLSPKILVSMANVAAETLKKDLPDSASKIEKCRQSFVSKATKLSQEIKKELKKCHEKRFFALHGAFGWFADNFGLIQDALEKGDKPPTAPHTAEWISKIKTTKPGFILTSLQAQNPVLAKIESTTNVKIIQINPMAPNPLETIKNIADILINHMCLNKRETK